MAWLIKTVQNLKFCDEICIMREILKFFYTHVEFFVANNFPFPNIAVETFQILY